MTQGDIPRFLSSVKGAHRTGAHVFDIVSNELTKPKPNIMHTQILFRKKDDSYERITTSWILKSKKWRRSPHLP